MKSMKSIWIEFVELEFGGCSAQFNSIHSTFLLFRMGRKVKNELELMSCCPLRIENGMNNEAKQEKQGGELSVVCWWVKGGTAARQQANKEDEPPPPTTLNLLAKKSKPLIAGGAGSPAINWCCLGVWVRESGAEWVGLFFSLLALSLSGLVGLAQPNAPREERQAAREREKRRANQWSQREQPNKRNEFAEWVEQRVSFCRQLNQNQRFCMPLELVMVDLPGSPLFALPHSSLSFLLLINQFIYLLINWRAAVRERVSESMKEKWMRLIGDTTYNQLPANLNSLNSIEGPINWINSFPFIDS